MSTILVNTLTGTSTAGSIAVTGEGGSTTTNLQQGLLKYWVNFDGTGTIAARDSLNASSVTDVGTGLYKNNATNAFSAATYSHVSFSGNYTHTTSSTSYADTTTSWNCYLYAANSTTFTDTNGVYDMAAGDLA